MSALAVVLILALQTPARPQVYTLPGGFTIEVPAPLKKLTAELLGKPLPPNTRSWLAKAEAAGYVVSQSDISDAEFREATADQLLARDIVGMMSSAQCVFESQRDLLLNGWPGIEVEGNSKLGIRMKARCYIVGHVVFQAGVSYLIGRQLPVAGSSFLDSMAFPKAAGHGPLRVAGPEFSSYALEGAAISVRMPSKPVRSEKGIGDADHPGKVIRFTSTYGNRAYAVAYIDMPESIASQAAGHETELLEGLNDDTVRSMEGTERHDQNRALGSLDVLSTTCKLPNGGGARIDTLLKGSRVYTFVAVVPQCLLKSDEVEAFFASAKPS